ncbi:O-antigen ligase family protein [Flavilitoribacter nigricans]|uniref:O-antigen ligase-related domain-containing protein n=1 Tax=Flavilitoribacter nigricans (strain ATCC 23147 / DSM 23189 / NBRC 102662 / NCIMB 1420 / SS-2) TaxID=1122177 RepID=A0A2D0NJ29_FLAN2|nr:O-antigen ligase family protein [Flavilitoribacter nigricans]PHN08400.1 hypothetical protein CRP01_00370 [Flavilitoribacter nigricans DSM 23189 = NBRC 102662]
MQAAIAHIRSWLHRSFLEEKLNNVQGAILLVGGAAFLSVLMVVLGLKIGVALIGLFIGVPVMILALVDLRFGLAVILVLAFFVNFISKYTSFPVGTGLDALFFLMFFGMMVRVAQYRDWKMPKGPVTTIILVWIGYNLLQVLNPEAPSRAAWLYTVRSLAILQLIYFVAHYAFRSLQDIKQFLKVFIILAIIAAVYGLKQEYFGYNSREWAWLYENPRRYQLIVQWSRYRVFSLFSDPTTFGTVMAYGGTFCFILATGPFRKISRVVLVLGGLAMMLSMAYAGSRTPFILIPAALGLYALLNLSKQVIIVVGVLTVLGAGMIMKSTSNPVIYRIQSAFEPTTDASVQVRLENQEIVQPYIQSHPFGAGLGTTGVWGERFSPDFWLAGFPHDSAYVRMAVETGWLGLVIYMAIFFIAFQVSVFYYFRVRNPQIKIMYLGLAMITFILGMASYPQEVVTLLPNSIIYYVLLAIVVRLKDFDTDPEEPVVSVASQKPNRI